MTSSGGLAQGAWQSSQGLSLVGRWCRWVGRGVSWGTVCCYERRGSSLPVCCMGSTLSCVKLTAAPVGLHDCGYV